ncbi:MAG: OprO/OprP family phosphate-selective porin [Candidatus Scalinduaceae bacterium]
MRNIFLVTFSTFVFLFFNSISFIYKAQGAQESDLAPLKKQLEIMEETLKKQQEMINTLRDKIESKEKVAQVNVPEREENEIERVVDNYLMKEETRKKMAKAGLIHNPAPFQVYWDKGLRFKSENGNFKLKLGGRIMNDWGWFTEDKDILESIGNQVDGTEFRRARLYIAGEIYENIAFKAQYDFASGGRPDFKDVYLALRKIPVVGNFRVGHFKEPFSLEELTSSKYITFMERSLNNVFAPARNTGFMLHNHALDKRMTWATGVFRNANGFGDSEGNRTTEGGYSFSGRITGLPWYKDKGKKLIHTGFSYSYQNAFENAFRFRSRPEMHMAKRFVDTGSFTADFANLFNPELAIVYGPFSLQTEYTFADVNLKRSMNSDPEFSGLYVYGSYFLTGEHRSYSTKKGSFSRVKPNRNFHWGRGKGKGAIELTARYSHLDLDDEAIRGGKLDDVTVGINWYLNPNTRVMFNYVHAEADLSNVGGKKDGNADLAAMRFQIDF